MLPNQYFFTISSVLLFNITWHFMLANIIFIDYHVMLFMSLSPACVFLSHQDESCSTKKTHKFMVMNWKNCYSRCAAKAVKSAK